MLLDLTRQSDYFWALLPEIVLSLWAMLVLLVDVFQKGNRSEPSRPIIPWLALAGLVLAAVANAYLLRFGEAAPVGLVFVDSFRVFANFIFLLAGAMALFVSMGYLDRKGINRGEFHVLVLFAVVGMMLMAASRDLMMMFVSLEVMSVAIYVLVGFDRMDPRSTEGALKYFLLGAFSSAFFLYGIALTFGATGTTSLSLIGPQVGAALAGGNLMLLAGAALLMVGLGFKVAAVPFHVWTPDAYDGAPTPVTALMATGVKAAAFAAFIRVFGVAFAGMYEVWAQIGFWLAALTMVVANLIALTQGSLKRMLAYSSIAHAGYLLVALLSAGSGGAAAFLFYLLVYTLMTAGAFGVLIANARGDSERLTLEDYAGFGWRHPLLGAAFAIFLLSLAGFPLTGGFIGKLYILRSALEAGLQPLAVILVLASLVSYFYYLRVIVVMYMQPSRETGEVVPLGVPTSVRFAIGAAAAAVLLLFFIPDGFGGDTRGPISWARESAASLVPGPPVGLFGANR
ncbi:MAG TPA: NADH-quinone oxidoreductase subunit N [Longimicrobiaceae bacterium]|nr:NADH-quinone oxidoreductase subunit N [Longimicrobiaceae bacterium]